MGIHDAQSLVILLDPSDQVVVAVDFDRVIAADAAGHVQRVQIIGTVARDLANRLTVSQKK